jgi:hypothetical protein
MSKISAVLSAKSEAQNSDYDSPKNIDADNDNRSEKPLFSQRHNLAAEGDSASAPFINRSDDGKSSHPKRGRPTSQPWYLRKTVGGKQVSRSLCRDEVSEIMNGAQHANVIGAPLNLLVTIKPARVDGIAPEERFGFWQDELKYLSQACRNDNVPHTYVWSREARQDGTGEHLHVLMHAPDGVRQTLAKGLGARHAGPGEVDVRRARTTGWRAKNGRHHSMPAYVAKEMSPQARFATNLNRKPGSPIAGKRCGTTRNVSNKAVEAFRKTLQ